jgi:hypothetical protein
MEIFTEKIFEEKEDIFKNTEVLESIKNKIEFMDKYHQIEILKILSNSKCKINENKSGIYINLTFLSKNTIDQLLNYIDFITEQEETIKTIEYQKKEYETAFFKENEKEDKDNTTIPYNSYNK